MSLISHYPWFIYTYIHNIYNSFYNRTLATSSVYYVQYFDNNSMNNQYNIIKVDLKFTWHTCQSIVFALMFLSLQTLNVAFTQSVFCEIFKHFLFYRNQFIENYSMYTEKKNYNSKFTPICKLKLYLIV